MSKEKDNPGRYITPKFCDERHVGLEKLFEQKMKLIDEKLKSYRNWLIGLMVATGLWLSVLQLILDNFR